MKAEPAIRRGSAGSIARFGSLSWFVSPLKTFGMMLTTNVISRTSATSAAASGGRTSSGWTTTFARASGASGTPFCSIITARWPTFSFGARCHITSWLVAKSTSTVFGGRPLIAWSTSTVATAHWGSCSLRRSSP